MKRLLIIILLFSSFVGEAQLDPIYSQMFNTPLYLNPANAGIYYGGSRLSMTVKDQWMDFGTPLRSSVVSFDKPILDDLYHSDFLAVGFMVYSDVTDLTRYQNNTVNLVVNYGKALDPQEQHFVAIAFMGGASQMAVTYQGLNWENQFNRFGFDQSLPSGESFTQDMVIHPDFNVGGMYIYNDEEKTMIKLGMSMFHVHRPTVSFMGGDIKQYRRFNFHGDFKLSAHHSTFSIWPKFVATIQGPHKTLTLGTDFHYLLKEAGNITGHEKEVTWSFGPYIRFKDAMMFQTRLTVGGLGIGLNYDFSLFSVNEITKLGGPEITLIYKSGYKKGRREKHNHKRFDWKSS